MKSPTIAMFLALILHATPSLAADLVETAAQDPALQTFVAALQEAGFASTLKSAGPFTVFAPSEAAFSKLPEATKKEMSEDKVRLSQVLSYHVIPGRITQADVRSGKVKTTEGSTVTFSKTGSRITINQATITEGDRIADNGVLHVIDTVLLPPE